MSDQATALRLAGQLDAELARTVAVDMLHHNAAAELRRLHAENEALRADLTENEALRERMADILRRTAVALRGPEPPRRGGAGTTCPSALRQRSRRST